MAHRSRVRLRARSLAAALASCAAAGCLSVGDAEPLRYYRAEGLAASAAPEPLADARGPELRLRRLAAAGHLRERIAVRTAPHEYELLELDRWTEPPLAYVERALSRAFFEQGGLRRSEELAAPALDVELLAFEEAREPGATAVVALSLRLFDVEGRSLLERTIVEREPLAEDGLAALSTALAAALERAARETALAVGRALAGGATDS